MTVNVYLAINAKRTNFQKLTETQKPADNKDQQIPLQNERSNDGK